MVYSPSRSPGGKPLVWLHGEVRTPPFSASARLEAGTLLRRLQRGEIPGMPHSRSMPSIAHRCHELRIVDGDHTWRILVRLDDDAILIGAVFAKKTARTPPLVVRACQRRFNAYDALWKE